MVTMALTHVLQEGPLPQRLVSLGATFCVDQCQSDWVGSYFLHQLQVLMSVHFKKKNSPQGAYPSTHPPPPSTSTYLFHLANHFPNALGPSSFVTAPTSIRTAISFCRSMAP